MENRYLHAESLALFGEEDFSEKMRLTALPKLNSSRRTGHFTSEDGTNLYYEQYPNSAEIGEIVISHGFCEFTAKYEEIIYYFYQAGYSVSILDYRGHGKSERKVAEPGLVHVESYEEYVADLHTFVTQIVTGQDKHKKLILFAHSMGGAIGALYLEQHPGVFSSAILSSPMLQVNAGVIPIPIVWALLWMKKLTKADKVYARGQRAFDGVPRFNTSSCLSEERYQHIFAKRMQERRYQTYGASWGWTLASLRAVRKLQKQAKKVDAPVLILQAEMDTMVGNKGQDAFARKSKNTMIVVVPGAKHEIYNGNSEMRQKFYYEIFHFLMEQ